MRAVAARHSIHRIAIRFVGRPIGRIRSELHAVERDEAADGLTLRNHDIARHIRFLRSRHYKFTLCIKVARHMHFYRVIACRCNRSPTDLMRTCAKYVERIRSVVYRRMIKHKRIIVVSDCHDCAVYVAAVARRSDLTRDLNGRRTRTACAIGREFCLYRNIIDDFGFIDRKHAVFYIANRVLIIITILRRTFNFQRG